MLICFFNMYNGQRSLKYNKVFVLFQLRVAQTSLLERNTQLQQLKQQLHQLKTLHETADKNHMVRS